MAETKWLSYKDYRNKQRLKNKYNSKKTVVDGKHFPSMLEADTYRYLKNLQDIGEIKSIELQQAVYLTDARISYKTDFKVVDKNEYVYWVEAKGFETEVYRIKKRLWAAGYGPGELHIYRRGSGLFKVILTEVIKPK